MTLKLALLPFSWIRYRNLVDVQNELGNVWWTFYPLKIIIFTLNDMSYILLTGQLMSQTEVYHGQHAVRESFILSKHFYFGKNLFHILNCIMYHVYFAWTCFKSFVSNCHKLRSGTLVHSWEAPGFCTSLSPETSNTIEYSFAFLSIFSRDYLVRCTFSLSLINLIRKN